MAEAGQAWLGQDTGCGTWVRHGMSGRVKETHGARPQIM